MKPYVAERLVIDIEFIHFSSSFRISMLRIDRIKHNED